MRRACCTLFKWAIAVLPFCTHAQNLTTEGRDFWLGFMENHETDPIELEIYISATDTTDCVVEMPAYQLEAAITAFPDSTVKVTMPTHLAMSRGSGILEKRGVHVTADKDITVYALNKRRVSSDATVILPTVSLGKEYMVMAHVAPQNPGPSLPSECLIVGVEDNTEIEIIPSVITLDGRPAKVPFTIQLDRGSTYQMKSDRDLTGTTISALNTTTGDCRNFAVFGGNEWTRVGGCGSAQDHLYEQMYPVNTWGREFISVPFKSRLGGDIIKILAAYDSTVIQVSNSQSIVLNRSDYTQILRSTPQHIAADQPISVAQFSRSQNCDGVEADPFMIMLSPVEQRLKSITFNAFDMEVVDRYYLNLITPTAGTGRISVDGNPVGGLFDQVQYNPQYSVAQVDISRGNHTIQSDSGFIAYVYGYGRIESFGYATGVSLKNLNLGIVAAAPGSDFSVPMDSACVGEEFAFKVEGDSSFIVYDWDFGDGTTGHGSALNHAYSKAGTYTVQVKAGTALGNCATEETAVRYVYVPKPAVQVLGPRSVCPNTDSIDYRLRVLRGDHRNTYAWVAGGGAIAGVEDGENLTINWGGTNSAAFVQVQATDYLGCRGDVTVFPVRINVQLDPSAPFGEEALCSDLADLVDYSTYLSNHSIYDWQTDFGAIAGGQGSNEVQINWQGPGTGRLWYRESSTLDSVCSGISDTLEVYIERAPDETLVLSAAGGYYNMDSVVIRVEADTAFRFYSWDFGDGHVADSIPGEDRVHHVYTCEGIYTVRLSAYTGTVCQNTGAGIHQQVIMPPALELVRVSLDTASESEIKIDWRYTGSDHYNQQVELYRQAVYPEPGNMTLIQSFAHDAGNRRDVFNDTVASVYQYTLETNHACNTVSTPPHNNILLAALTDGEDSVTSLAWNEYINWKGGVERYDIWRKVDAGPPAVFSETGTTNALYSYDQDGFDFCYRIRAREQGGNGAVSWSNKACVAFVPHVKAYNLFTPNNDRHNEVLVFDRIELYPDSELEIFNRYGKTVATFTGYRNDWDGRVRGRRLPPGVYFYHLALNEPRNTTKVLKGSFSILY
jgi:gliding motility-associated-like protein